MLITPQNARQWARSEGFTASELKTQLHDVTWCCWTCEGLFSRESDGEDTDDGWTCDGCAEIPFCERSAGGAYSPYRVAA